jgi:hypothetical protein
MTKRSNKEQCKDEDTMLQLLAIHEITQTYKEIMQIMREAELSLYNGEQRIVVKKEQRA